MGGGTPLEKWAYLMGGGYPPENITPTNSNIIDAENLILSAPNLRNSIPSQALFYGGFYLP